MLCEVRNIKKKYPVPGESGLLTILDDISLSIDRGQSLAVMGPSGSGKTTLLNIIASIDRPDAGEVIIGGENLSALDEKALALTRSKKIGVVFQQHYLLPQCTLYQNVLIPTIPLKATVESAERQERAARLLDRVKLTHRKNHLPGQLSGGECQRAAVVRALINKPDILCADEPTGSLDRKSSDNLGEMLLELNREEEVALFVVTHSESLARKMDSRKDLIDGKCVDQ